MVLNQFLLPFELRIKAHYIRFTLIPLLSLILAHLISYGKLPFDDNYQFPLIPFGVILVVGLGVCETNRLNYLRLVKKNNVPSASIKGIVRLITSNILHSSVVFVLLTAAINLVLSGTVPAPTRFISFIFIVSLITMSETLVFIIWDYYKASRTSSQSSSNADTWVIDSGASSQVMKKDDIAYFHSINGIVKLVLLNGKSVTTNFNSLNQIENEFDIDGFFRINRQYLVKVLAIEKAVKDVNRKLKVQLKPTLSQFGSEIIVSRYKSVAFKKWLKDTSVQDHSQ